MSSSLNLSWLVLLKDDKHIVFSNDLMWVLDRALSARVCQVKLTRSVSIPKTYKTAYLGNLHS